MEILILANCEGSYIFKDTGGPTKTEDLKIPSSL